MPKFSQKSTSKLSTAHRDLQTLMREAIKIVDFTIVYGHRSSEEQAELYKMGRPKGEIVTYCDGKEKRSQHNFTPSRAVDIVPYPEGWEDLERFHFVAGVIMTTARRLLEEGKIDNIIEWGGDWRSFKDLPHFQIK